MEGFAATLEETLSAELVLHVLDASAPDEELDRMIAAVEEVLAEIGAAELPVELVLNKIDAVDPLTRRRLGNRFPDAVQISALTGEGLQELRSRIAERFSERFELVRLLVPHTEGAKLAELYALGTPIDEREDTEEGVFIRARLPRRELARFAPYLIALGADSSASASPSRTGRLGDRAPGSPPPGRRHFRLRPMLGDAGLDLAACDRHEVGPGERAVIPPGWRSRSRRATAGSSFLAPASPRSGITLLNAPG